MELTAYTCLHYWKQVDTAYALHMLYLLGNPFYSKDTAVRSCEFNRASRPCRDAYFEFLVSECRIITVRAV